jgi:membrane fusion protein, multidrug efflux system
MDERTRRTDDEATPNFRRTAPAPIIERPRDRTGRFIVGLIVLIGIVLGSYELVRVFRASQPAAGRSQPLAAAQSVGAATVGQGDIRVVVNALGTVTPLATVTVQTQIDGQLTSVGFTEGQSVKKGDFLAQIDPRPYQAALQQAEGQLVHDQELLDEAQMDLTRYENLVKTQAITRQQYEDQIYVVKQYEGSVKSDQAQIDTQKLNLVYCHIVSPVDGRVGLRLVDPGNFVQTTDTTGIVVVTQLQPITVEFPVPEDDIPQITARLRAGATLQVTAFDRADVTRLATGKLSTYDNQIDTTTGTVKLRAEFDNSHDELFPNQFVNARLLVRVLHDVVRVPVPAIQRGEPGTYVYAIDAGDTVSVRAIQLGPTDGGMAQVVSGLSPGDRVVIDGADRLRDGMKVTVPAAANQNGAAPGNPPAPARGNSGPPQNAQGHPAPQGGH